MVIEPELGREVVVTVVAGATVVVRTIAVGLGWCQRTRALWTYSI